MRGGTDISDSTKTYQGITTSGSISFAPYNAFSRKVSGVYTVDNRGNSNGSNLTFNFCDYNSLLGGTEPNLVGNGVKTAVTTVLADTVITQATKATVDAYTTIDDGFELYDRAKSYLYDNFAGEVVTIVDRAGLQIDLVSYNLVIDATAGSAFAFNGSTITIKSSQYTGDMVTTGVITLLNGATFSGTRTDTNGTVSPDSVLTLTGLQANSEVRVYTAGTTTEVAGVENSGTTFVDATIAVSSVDIVVHNVSFEYLKIEAADTSNNLTLPIQQRSDRQYENV